jgi:hypothetical protein
MSSGPPNIPDKRSSRKGLILHRELKRPREVGVEVATVRMKETCDAPSGFCDLLLSESSQCPHLCRWFPNMLELDFCGSKTAPFLANPIHSLHLVSQLEENSTIIDNTKKSGSSPWMYGEEQQRTVAFSQAGIPERFFPLTKKHVFHQFNPPNPDAPKPVHIVEPLMTSATTMDLGSSTPVTVSVQEAAANVPPLSQSDNVAAAAAGDALSLKFRHSVSFSSPISTVQTMAMDTGTPEKLDKDNNTAPSSSINLDDGNKPKTAPKEKDVVVVKDANIAGEEDVVMGDSDTTTTERVGKQPKDGDAKDDTLQKADAETSHSSADNTGEESPAVETNAQQEESPNADSMAKESTPAAAKSEEEATKNESKNLEAAKDPNKPTSTTIGSADGGGDAECNTKDHGMKIGEAKSDDDKSNDAKGDAEKNKDAKGDREQSGDTKGDVEMNEDAEGDEEKSVDTKGDVEKNGDINRKDVAEKTADVQGDTDKSGVTQDNAEKTTDANDNVEKSSDSQDDSEKTASAKGDGDTQDISEKTADAKGDTAESNNTQDDSEKVVEGDAAKSENTQDDSDATGDAATSDNTQENSEKTADAKGDTAKSGKKQDDSEQVAHAKGDAAKSKNSQDDSEKTANAEGNATKRGIAEDDSKKTANSTDNAATRGSTKADSEKTADAIGDAVQNVDTKVVAAADTTSNAAKSDHNKPGNTQMADSTSEKIASKPQSKDDAEQKEYQRKPHRGKQPVRPQDATLEDEGMKMPKPTGDPTGDPANPGVGPSTTETKPTPTLKSPASPSGPSPAVSSSILPAATVSAGVKRAPIAAGTPEYHLPEARFMELSRQEEQVNIIRSLLAKRYGNTKKKSKKRKLESQFSGSPHLALQNLPGSLQYTNERAVGELDATAKKKWVQEREGARLTGERWMDQFRASRRAYWKEEALSRQQRQQCTVVPKTSTAFSSEWSTAESLRRTCQLCPPRKSIHFSGDELLQCLECSFVGCGPAAVAPESKDQHILQHLFLSGHKFGMYWSWSF